MQNPQPHNGPGNDRAQPTSESKSTAPAWEQAMLARMRTRYPSMFPSRFYTMAELEERYIAEKERLGRNCEKNGGVSHPNRDEMPGPQE